MDFLSELAQEIIAHKLASSITVALVVAIMKDVIKWMGNKISKEMPWESIRGKFSFLVVTWAVIFTFLFLIEQSNLSSQQAEIMEKLVTQSEQHTGVLDEAAVVNQQSKEALEKLAGGVPTSPLFVQTNAEIRNFTGRQLLTVAVRNNAVQAKDVVSRILVLDKDLDLTRGPIYPSMPEKSANDIGPRGPYSHHLSIRIKKNTRPFFVVFQIQYANSQRDETFSQAWFWRFKGSSQDGTFY